MVISPKCHPLGLFIVCALCPSYSFSFQSLAYISSGSLPCLLGRVGSLLQSPEVGLVASAAHAPPPRTPYPAPRAPESPVQAPGTRARMRPSAPWPGAESRPGFCTGSAKGKVSPRQKARWKGRFRLLRAQGIFMGCRRAAGREAGPRGPRLPRGRDAPLARVPCGPRRGFGACGKRPRVPNLGTRPLPIRRRPQPGSGESPAVFLPLQAGRGGAGRADGGGKEPGEGGRCAAPLCSWGKQIEALWHCLS